MQSNLKIVFLIVLITLITYINILPNKLFFDDEELIYKNAYVQNIKYLPRFFSENMIAGAGKISNMYRPVLMITFAFDHLFWNNNPVGYHLTSIILHAANGILIYLLLRNLFGSFFIAFITSLFFVIHPVAAEAVTYASGRTDPLYSFFALISLNIYLSWLKSEVKDKFKFSISIFFFVLSLLSKESAVILPLVFPLIYFAYHKQKDIDYSKLAKFIWPFYLIDLIYILLRMTVFNFSDTLNFYTTNNIYSQNLLVRILTFTRVFFEYLLIIIYPKDLIFARKIPLVTSFNNVYLFGFIFLTILLSILSFKLWKKTRVFLFSLIWFLITMLPVSGIIPINSIITEHYLYLPSLSYFLMASLIAKSLWDRFSNIFIKIGFSVAFILIVFLLSYRTIIRNSDWRDPITFYTKSLKQSPWHIPMHNNLAMAYAEQGRSDEAIREYQKTIQLEDVYPNLHHNLANTYKDQGKYQEAEKEYKKALDMDPNFIFSYYGLADLYQKTGEKEKLEEIIKKLK